MKKLLAARLSLFLTLAGTILFFFAVYRFGLIRDVFANLMNIMTPIVIGVVLAYLLTPICRRLERLLTPPLSHILSEKRAASLARGIAIFCSILFAFAVIYLLVALIIPQVISSISGLVETLPTAAQKLFAQLEAYLSAHSDNETLTAFVENIIQQVQDWLKGGLTPWLYSIALTLSASVMNLVQLIKNVLIGTIVCIYLLGSRNIFADQSKKLLYSLFKTRTANFILREVRHTHAILGGFINGKLLDSAIIGVICFGACTLFQFPYAMLVSVIIGVTNIIPFFGPFIGAIPSALLILLVSPVKCLYFIVLIIVLQQFDGNILGPKILGNSTGLSSFWVLFSLLLFGGIFGFPGMILGVPVFAVLYHLVKLWVEFSLARKNLPTSREAYSRLEAIDPESGEVLERRSDS